MDNAEYKCHLCTNKYPLEPEKQERHQKIKGCFTPRQKPLPFTWEHVNKGGARVNFFKCPASFFSGTLSGYISVLTDWPNILPFEGTILDQPSKIVDLANLVQNLLSESQNCKLEEQRKKNGRQ